MKNVMLKNLTQSILRSITRYIAIVAIIALGAGMFVGLRTTKSDMILTGQEYLDEQNMFDLRLLNSYGWSLEDVEKIAQISGVDQAEGVISMDALAYWAGSSDELVYKIYSLPERINKVLLLGGRMPQNANECLVDGAHVDDSILGTTFVISEKNSDSTLDSFSYTTYTVVGYVSSPLYMDMSRGTTTLGNGTVSGYVYIPGEAFDVDYYTEIDITIRGDYGIYTEEYDTAMDDMAVFIEPHLQPLAHNRYESVLTEAEDAYAEGLQTYLDGLNSYQEGREEALSQLEEALQELLNGQEEIDENRLLLEDAMVQLEEAQTVLDAGTVTIITSRQELAAAKAEAYAQLAEAYTQLMDNRAMVTSNLAMVRDGIAQIDNGLIQIESGITQLESGLSQLELTVTLLETMVSVLDLTVASAEAALEDARDSILATDEYIAMLEAQLADLHAQQERYHAQLEELQLTYTTYSAQLEELYVQQEELTAQRAELVGNQALLEEGLAAIEEGMLELQANETMVQNQFASAESQLEAAQMELDLGQIELNARRQEALDGLAALEEAQTQLDEGWVEYNNGRDEVMRELAEAETELMKAQIELTSARQTIDAMEEPAIFALTRNTNVGYLSLDSNSDIVEGISAVFPAFFLLIAALVCITTMTRMVEEERTQIGTLKALGYSNSAIIGKYLAYAGSAAVLGCGLGVLLGSGVFPMILWEAYNIILNIRPNISLQIDWPLCLVVVGAYTAVTLLVTWYCCRMALREVPAELIRPKPPTTGKKIFLEYLPFWNRFSFLNKVMLRNIFRYRQRLLMMLVGIGGCTALLLTGFGVRDSIVDIVSYQFEEVTLYDLEARFNEGLDADGQEAFRQEIGRYVDRIVFAHQSSVELDFDSQTRDIILISAYQELENVMDLHRGDEAVSMPGIGEAVLSIGVCEKLGIRVGDTVTIRDADMRVMELTVSGIYDNNVYNYVLVNPETVARNLGGEPELQMAYLCVRDDQDVHYAGTKVTSFDGVMNVTVCEDLAEQVGSMLDALNLVVATVVVCAGMLAVTVLYNLTNINITERIREIATIKVLGFNSWESAAYVFKENLLLSGMGAVCGLFFGYALLEFVMSQIKVDMVWMQARLLPESYVWAILLTMLSALLVDFVLYFKLEKINMAEALKSVE